MAEVAATRSAALALADERSLMRQGYQFLDEKRMLLAAEMLRRLREHQAHETQLVALMTQAQAALRAALQRHGLETLQAWRAPTLNPTAPTLQRSQFLGVARMEAVFAPRVLADEALEVDPSPEAAAARAAFAALLAPLAALAATTANLQRLAAEYRRTERRARALENVLLPEIEQALKAINEHLELADQEDAVRIRHAGR